MRLVVVDTSTLASGFLRRSPATPPVMIVEWWRAGRFVMVTSEPLVAELDRTLRNRYFQNRLTESDIAGAIHILRTEAVMTQLRVTVSGVAKHPEDDLILATAVSARADCLVSSDSKLQQLGFYAGVDILSPRAFTDRTPELLP